MSNPAAKHPTPRSHLVAALACAACGLVLFQFFGNATRGYINTPSLFWWWANQWLDRSSETEHGWIVLAVSAWLLWKNLRTADAGHQATSDSPGAFSSGSPIPANPPPAVRHPQSIAVPVAAMIAGLALHALGFMAQQSRISIMALLVFAWGVLRLAGGRAWGAAALFPLGFMIFAIPISMLDEIGLPLRLGVTSAGERIAHFGGIDVLRNGTQLVAPDGRFNYDVAAPCSGVRSLVALTALSVLVGYLNFHAWWRRALVVVVCFPLVYLGNVVRIVAIIFAAQWGGLEWGERVHEVMGYGVFAIVLAGLLGMVSAIHRRWPELKRKNHGEERDDGLKENIVSGHAGARGRAARPYLAVFLTVILAVGEMFFLHRLANLPARGEVGVVLAADGRDPVELPAFIGTEWMGRRAEVSAVEREVLPADTGFSRRSYVAIDNPRRSVFVSIVLSGRDRTSIHRPELCLVGQGWTIANATKHAFQVPPNASAGSKVIPATLLRVNRAEATTRGKIVVPQLVAYWFVSGDSVVASHWERFLHDAWNRVVHARVDRWAYVLVQTDAVDGETAALARMQTILSATLPVFQKPFASAAE